MNNELNYNETNQELNIDSLESSISIEEETPSISFDNEDIELSFISEENEIGFESPYSVGGTKDHSQLKNLDFESSGHTGFQPAGNYALKDDVPTKTSQLNNDSGFIAGYIETDPTVPQHVKGITKENIEQWNKGKTYTGGDNTAIEENKINVYTNTGYKVIDKDIQIQSIIDSETTGTNKIVYAEDKEIMFIIDGTNKLRKSENCIDFEVLTMPRKCKDMLYMNGFNRLLGLSDDGYFFYSDDLGLNWTEIKNSNANNINYLVRPHDFNKSFGVVNIASKTITSLQENFTQNTKITSTIAPNFWAKANDSQFIWCNNTGTFKYGAGSKEGGFASLSGITVNLLKRVNNITMLGLKNDNRIYLLEPATSITDYKWIEYSLPDTCTVNDIIYNPYDETYYIFTDINTYYKTKDFVNYESVDKNSLRGIQGYFTSEGIQMTTSNHNEILLAPTRTKLENKAQEWDRLAKKELWVGDGLELTEEGKVNVKTTGGNLSVSSNGVYLIEVDENHLTLDILEGIYVAKAELWLDFDPYTMDMWYWESAVPYDTLYKASKIVFNQAGSFYDQITYETEIFVEQYEYGYLFCDQNMTVFKYVKLGNLSWLFN